MADPNYDEADDVMTPRTTSEEQSVANDTNDTPDNDKSDETEDKLALVPKHFFKGNMKPGDREMVEVVQSYEGEYSLKCVYGDKDDDKEEAEPDEGEAESESEPEDEAYV